MNNSRKSQDPFSEGHDEHFITLLRHTIGPTIV